MGTLGLAGRIGVSLALLAVSCGEHRPPPVEPTTAREPPTAQYAQSVAPVIEKRCAVCHGGYDSPCQLDLASYAGLERGAAQSPVYDSSRLAPAQPARLFVDERSEAGWRARGFTSIVRGGPARALLPRMLALGGANPLAADERLPASLPLDASRPLACPRAEAFDTYEREHPLGGMPYGMAPLSKSELDAIASWLAAGAPPPLPAPTPPPEVLAQVASWEAFLNGESLEQRLVARYLYEHWFALHLYFQDHARGPFFRVVRSRTPIGVEADEIATVRPYDDPGVPRVFYRLVPVQGALLHKTHVPYELGPAKMARLRSLFLRGDWKASRLPGYGRDAGPNPFGIFREIPARSRYQFLLDDSRSFVASFARGPACHGRVAIDAIEDRFFVAFLDPDRDLSVLDPGFLPRVADLLDVPAEPASDSAPEELSAAYDAIHAKYLNERAKTYAARDPKQRGPTLDSIWDGGKRDPDALLTVYRHFDGAAVVRGFAGTWPKTAWVMDYPIFERLYYDLVAGFDVFGSANHQLATRLSLDHLRRESESNFLAFLPAAKREAVRASWSRGAPTKPLADPPADRPRSEKSAAQPRSATPDPVGELLAKMLARAGAAGGPPDDLNRCAGKACDRPGVERSLRRLGGVRGRWVARMPELSILRVRGRGLYSLIRDDARAGAAGLYGGDDRRELEADVVTLGRGIAGSGPNFVFDVTAEEVDAFVDSLLAVRDDAGMDRLVERYGLRRTSRRFWPTIDEIQAEFARAEPTEAALLDLGRYEND